MPAVTERRVYRPVGPRMVAIVAGGCLIALFVAVAATLPPDVRAAFTILQTGTLLLFLGALLAALWGIARSRVVVDDAGVHVTNGYRTHHVAWTEILDVAYPDGAPWPTLATRDDRRVMMLGLPSSDGSSAREAVWYLRERLLDPDEGSGDGAGGEGGPSAG